MQAITDNGTYGHPIFVDAQKSPITQLTTQAQFSVLADANGKCTNDENKEANRTRLVKMAYTTAIELVFIFGLLVIGTMFYMSVFMPCHWMVAALAYSPCENIGCGSHTCDLEKSTFIAMHRDQEVVGVAERGIMQLECDGGNARSRTALQPSSIVCDPRFDYLDDGDSDTSVIVRSTWRCEPRNQHPKCNMYNVRVRCQGVHGPGDRIIIRDGCRAFYEFECGTDVVDAEVI